MSEAIESIGNSETERELLAGELALGFMVFGWVASAVPLRISTARFRQAAPELRASYKDALGRIPELNRQWKEQGLSLRERALRSYQIRSEARIRLRNLTEQELNVRNLQARDLLVYGRPNGPTFEEMIAIANSKGYHGDAAYEYIISGSARSNAAFNEAVTARGNSGGN